MEKTRSLVLYVLIFSRLLDMQWKCQLSAWDMTVSTLRKRLEMETKLWAIHIQVA